MGNKASKVASQTTRAATQAVKEPRNIDIKGEAVKASSFTKDSDILKDASDPSFSATDAKSISQNLARLGQATVRDAQAQNSNRFAPDVQAAKVLQRRAQLEESEVSDMKLSSVRNRLTANNLSILLDARKEIKTMSEMRRLCEDFNCDVDYVQKLARYVTSPSLTLQRTKQQEKEDTYLARWVDPAPPQERIAA